MDIITRLTDLSRLGQGPLVVAAVVAVASYVYSDQILAYVSNDKTVFTLVYLFAGLGVGTFVFA